ncbi:hypothetical protein ACFQ4L_10390 [Lapidilactobacillus mulanensis]|uniref:Phage tail protein n=1 Tax=Lapidilactobacillus mulanensis TaxID=2485999 RepID=A0ABW4DQV6_9LACO|nr:hypothetical protein [Lapidilactobacillus mulanensis]
MPTIIDIKFGDKWALQNYGLYLSPGIVLEDPEPRTDLIDNPAGDGSIDVSEALTGEIRYKDRNIELTLAKPKYEKGWQSSLSSFVNDVHGRRIDVVLPLYPDYHFVGRLRAVADFRGNKGLSIISVTGVMEPYRYKNELTKVSATVPDSGSLTLNLVNERMTTLPTFTISADSQITFNATTYSHIKGTFTLANVFLTQGDNPITIKATAGTKVTITYQEGAL